MKSKQKNNLCYIIYIIINIKIPSLNETLKIESENKKKKILFIYLITI